MERAVAPGSDRALASYWVATAATAGMAAGTPWAWAREGLLPAAAFASIGALLGWAHWRSPRLNVPWWSGGFAACLCGMVAGPLLGAERWNGWPPGALFGFFARPHRDPVYAALADRDPVVAVVFGGVHAAFGCVAFGVVGLVVRGWVGRWRAALAAPDCAALVWAAAASVCLGSAVAWTVTNEWYVPHWPHFFRRLRDPDVGPLALLAYALAALGYAVALRRARQRIRELFALRSGSHPRLVLVRGEHPNADSIPWIWADPRETHDPRIEPDRWSAVVVTSSTAADYRSKPAIVGWMLGDGSADLSILRRREQRIARGLAVACTFGALQMARSVETRARQRADMAAWAHVQADDAVAGPPERGPSSEATGRDKPTGARLRGDNQLMAH